MTDTAFKKQLVQRYVNNKATGTEVELLYTLMERGELDNELLLVMEEVWEREVNEPINNLKPNSIFSAQDWAWQYAAAAILLIGVYFAFSYFSGQYNQPQIASVNTSAPILPGKNTAVITLANGQRVQLSNKQSGVVMAGPKGLRYTDGTDLGVSAGQGGRGEIAVITTPRGGTYQITLADGSKVQLNAASSLTFKSSYEGLPQRIVQLSGEAYFEVAKRKEQPFVVITRNQRVSVLGTHFNISAYVDDIYSLTTLLEGSVKINDQLLKPNEQARQRDGQISIKHMDAEDAVDWKNGTFSSRNESLEQLMKKVSRWYDVDVFYENNRLKEKTFSGSLSRYAKVEDLLEALKFYGINSKVARRNIYITN